MLYFSYRQDFTLMKKHSHLGAVEHCGHQGASLSHAECLFVRNPFCTLWTQAEAGELSTLAGQDVHISQCSLDSNEFGSSREAGRSKTTLCQLKQTSQAQIPIPTMREFLSPSSHPYHHLKKIWLRATNYFRTREGANAGAVTLAWKAPKDK